MTRQKKDVELEKAKMLKSIRTAVRLKHSLAADEELNRVLPAAEDAFDTAVRGGTLPDAPTLMGILNA